MALFSLRLLRGASAAALLAGLAVLAWPAPDDDLSWQALLAPYSGGAPLPDNFYIEHMRRGAGNDVVLDVRRPSDGATVEVHLVARGRWPGIRESASFGIAYETPRSPAREREDVTEALAQAVRARDPGGLPAPDAIALSTADPTALPWWLELARGGRGQLFGLGLLALALVALLPSAGVAGVGLLLGLAALVAGAAGTLGAAPDRGGAWLLPLAAGLALAARRGAGWGPAADRWRALALGAGALALRLGLGAWGPLHVNGYGPLFVEGAARDAAVIAAYGPGYVELFAPLAALAPARPDWAIFAANALASALLAPLAFALARLVGVTRGAALVAGVLVAIDPVAIRTGATESYFPVLILLCGAAAALLLIGVRALEADARWRAAAACGAAALLLAQAVRIHPAAWALAATVPFVALAGARRVWPHALGLTLAGGAIAAGVLVATSGGVLLDVLGNVRVGTLMRPQPPPTLAPLAWLAAAAAAYLLAAPRRWLALPAALCLAALVLTRHGYAQSEIWQHAYDRLYLLLPIVAAAALLPTALLRRTWLVAPAALLLAFAWLRVGLPIVTARTTDHLEYRWLRAQFAPLPAACRISYIAHVDKRGIVLPTYVGPPSRPAVMMQPRAPHTVEAALVATDCHYYVRTSLCSSREGRAACDAVEARLTLQPVARATFPALPSTRFHAYDRDPVEVVVSRVATGKREPRMNTDEHR